MKHLNKALALIVLASSSAAFAASDFDSLDIDGSGTISPSEAAVDTDLMAEFIELDTDGSGELSKEEFANLASSSAAYAAVDFASFDADGDGAITMEEAKVNPQLVKIFDDLDTDGNGEISKEEFSKVQ